MSPFRCVAVKPASLRREAGGQPHHDRTAFARLIDREQVDHGATVYGGRPIPGVAGGTSKWLLMRGNRNNHSPFGVQTMRYVILALAILLSPAISTQAQAQSQLSISIGNRGVSLGFAMSTYPALVRIPGYPVYYDPRVDSNYFFYDGLYWVFQDDNWYSSPWYDGPWDMIPPAYVPLFVLRIPVRYYRRPPAYFRDWRRDDAPRWGERWGRDWERQRSGWDRWDRRAVPRAAPLPTYQRSYTGGRYPRQVDQQRSIESRNYRYQPREEVSRQILDQRRQEAGSRDRQQQQQNDRRQQRQPEAQQRQGVQQQQRARQQNLRQQQQQEAQQQQGAQQQQQQQRARQQQSLQQQQQQPRQQRPQPAPKEKGRGHDNKDKKGQSDKNRNDNSNSDNSGHP